jgi:hypothetical protein
MDLTVANSIHPTSTLERPADRLLKRFKVSDVGNDTVGGYLRRGFSLAICCKDCPRIIEWTPPELERRFPPHSRIADIASRLSCSGPGGCGHKEVAVFAHLYDLPYRWIPADGSPLAGAKPKTAFDP